MNNQICQCVFYGLLAMLCCGCEFPADTTFKDGIIYCSEGNPDSFNPQTTTNHVTLDASAHQIYDRLIEREPYTGNYLPGLALSWQLSDDKQTLDLTLRRDVAFHTTKYFMPSRPFNADDVLFTFNRWRLKTHAFYPVAESYPHMQSYQLRKVITDIKKLSEYKVRFTFAHSNHDFLSHLASDYMSILSAEYAKALEKLDAKTQIDKLPIGTGPYLLVDYIKDEYIRFKAHSDYWQGSSTLKNLVFDITPQSSRRLAKLVTGECDVVAHPAASEMALLQEKANIALQSKAAENTAFWAFNTNKPPFDQIQVRRALAMAIDRQSIYRSIFYGTAFPAESVVASSSWGHHSGLPKLEYNPEKAAKLLAQANIPQNFSLEIWSPHIERAYAPNSLKMAELIRSDLARVGIKSTIVSYEWSTLRRKLAEQDYDTVLMGWTADLPSPDNYLQPVFSCAAKEAGINYANWCQPEFDDLINSAMQAPQNEIAQGFYHQAQSLLRQEMPVMPIAHSMSFLAKRRHVINVKFVPFSAISFKNAEKY
ncbi:ABC transporter substrate-binding protein [Gayadomonas joobiniege]|uniref:ABC transporter substrate-binding protein n=1 Tax=Gayadomonas joobiniege TaxID=1234606 RepID=UPI0003711D69|nr:ABC transporter substrate-binding protein [Gayadomonas joobiniege]